MVGSRANSKHSRKRIFQGVPICLSLRLFLCLSVCLVFPLSVCLSIFLSVCMSVCLSVILSFYLFISLSVYRCIALLLTRRAYQRDKLLLGIIPESPFAVHYATLFWVRIIFRFFTPLHLVFRLASDSIFFLKAFLHLYVLYFHRMIFQSLVLIWYASITF